jgi:hypothetical protein
MPPPNGGNVERKMSECPRFIRFASRDGWSETVNISEIQRISKSEVEDEGCRVILKDGTVIHCLDSMRTLDARLDAELEAKGE